jgi:hypothetical protein
MSTSIALLELRLGLVSDLSDEIILSADLNMDVRVTEEDAIVEEEEITASGAVRSIIEPGNPRRVGVSADSVDRATREALAARKGVMQQLRDPTGRQLFGTYAALAMETQPGGVSQVSFTLSQRTHSIEV